MTTSDIRVTLYCRRSNGGALAQIALRLPEHLHHDLRATPERTGWSLGQLMVTALKNALAGAGLAGQVEGLPLPRPRHIQQTPGDLATGLDV